MKSKENKEKQKKKNGQNTAEVMEGYNPRIYRRLSMLFGMLTILNLVVIMYAFTITGYGLWHAEDALSCIAKINGSFEEINQSVLKISINAEDKLLVSNNINNILSYHQDITKYAEEFRQIDLHNIDSTIADDFDTALGKIELYYNTVFPKLKDVRNGDADASILQSTETESLREDAVSTISALFEKQDEATYLFFCRLGQGFLLLPLFIILTMSAGLYAISRSKKRDYEFALNLQSSKEKTESIRQKAMELAYTNVVTGLKNRYAFNEKLEERLPNETVNVVLYNFNQFRSIQENYGRDFADEFITAVSKKISTDFGDQAEIFSTETEELCLIFNPDILKGKSISIAHKILETLAQPVRVRNVSIQLDVAGCICHCTSGAYPSTNSLFVAMDQCMKQAIAMCAEQNKSLLLPVS